MLHCTSIGLSTPQVLSHANASSNDVATACGILRWINCSRNLRCASDSGARAPLEFQPVVAAIRPDQQEVEHPWLHAHALEQRARLLGAKLTTGHM